MLGFGIIFGMLGGGLTDVILWIRLSVDVLAFDIDVVLSCVLYRKKIFNKRLSKPLEHSNLQDLL